MQVRINIEGSSMHISKISLGGAIATDWTAFILKLRMPLFILMFTGLVRSTWAEQREHFEVSSTHSFEWDSLAFLPAAA